MHDRVAIVDPVEDTAWNQKVLLSDDSTIFHSSNWARLLGESYGYRPMFFITSEGSGFRSFVPIVEVNSYLTGKRGVSISFADYCPAILHNKTDFDIIFRAILETGRNKNWQYVELRGEPLLEGQSPIKVYAHHQIELSNDNDNMAVLLRDSTARNIKKAIKEGVCVEISQSMKAVEHFYNLHCLTRKRHGLPPQPKVFFLNLYRNIIAGGYGFTALAKYKGVIIAGLVCLYFGKNAVYKYGASNMEFQHLRSNNLLLWESMRTCALQGCNTLSLGRTDLENEGLLAFKNGWGGKYTLMNYYRYDFASQGFIHEPFSRLSTHCNKVFSHLPVTVLRAIGRIAYPHIG